MTSPTVADPSPLIFLQANDTEAERHALLILEEGQWYELSKGWRVRADKPHVPGMHDHNHLYLKGDQIAVVNRNGTSSHNSDLSKIPGHVWKKLKSQRLIEEAQLLMETATDMAFVVPLDVMEEAMELTSERSRAGRFIKSFIEWRRNRRE